MQRALQESFLLKRIVRRERDEAVCTFLMNIYHVGEILWHPQASDILSLSSHRLWKAPILLFNEQKLQNYSKAHMNPSIQCERKELYLNSDVFLKNNKKDFYWFLHREGLGGVSVDSGDSV